MKSLLAKQYIVFFAILISAVSCKQPETVIVAEAPTSAVKQDTTDTAAVEQDTGFQKLVIGEYNNIDSLDPLFADNGSELRALQLLYEGLVRFDETGTIVPGMAKSWTVSDDSLNYTFYLRPDIFFHDSDIFSTGQGRRMVAADVKFVFERMASPQVPPRAARLFMNIYGFESYFQEQHYVYNPQHRELEGISGIRTPTDSTVVFQLIKPDPHFLQKLATPLASIYPREALEKDAFTPVGTGPFNFAQVNDSTFIFSRFNLYYAADNIALNRVDVKIVPSEMLLFKYLSRGELDLIPQLGPQLMSEILTPEGALLPAYEEQYELHTPGGVTEYILRYNPHSNVSEAAARKIAGFIETDSASYFGKLPALVRAQKVLANASAIDTTLTEIHTTFSTDPYIKTFLGSFSETLEQQNISLQMMNIRVPFRNTALVFTRNYQLIPAGLWSNFEKIFSFKVYHAALQKTTVDAFPFNQYSWWIDARNIAMPQPDN